MSASIKLRTVKLQGVAASKDLARSLQIETDPAVAATAETLAPRVEKVAAVAAQHAAAVDNESRFPAEAIAAARAARLML